VPPYENFTKVSQTVILMLRFGAPLIFLFHFQDFAKEVFAGKKQLLKLPDVRQIQVPKYDELSVKNLYGKLIELPGMAKYFPSSYPKGRQIDREYMFDVANTLHRDVVKELIEHAL